MFTALLLSSEGKKERLGEMTNEIFNKNFFGFIKRLDKG